ncbi:MAG TPA: FAD binding domain-containing protein [Pyrinomonadaceae bacterium]
MRSFIPAYSMKTPRDVAEALAILAAEPGTWRPFAGGTDLMVLLEAGKLPDRNYLNIWNLNELRGIEVTDEAISLGALTTYTGVQRNPILRAEFPMLCQAAAETGGLAIQNRGTLGGNIVNASPAADSPPALLAYDAELELISLRGSRRVAYRDFHTGYKQMKIEAHELLSRVHMLRSKRKLHQYYRKVGTRKAQAISKVCFAGMAEIEGEVIKEIRIALGSIAPIPLRCVRTEAALRGQRIENTSSGLKVFEHEIAPIDDIRSTRDYRLRVSLNLLEDFLSQLGRFN